MANKKSVFPKKLIDKMNDLILKRILKNLYSGFDDQHKKEMSDVFDSSKKKNKEEFIKNNLPNFDSVFEEELKKLSEEIKAEMAVVN